MGFSYLTNISLDEARDGYLEFLTQQGASPKTERIKSVDSVHRVSSAAVYAVISSPHFHAAAMDGIAVRAADTFGATQTTPIVLAPSQYVVVDTGDPIPEHCDAVIMIEDLLEDHSGIKLLASAAPWQHIRQIGEDICAGEMIIPSATQITPAIVGSLLAGGVLEIEAYARPRIGIIPTGDEVISPTDDPPIGAIMEFNSSIFSGRVQELGGTPKVYPITPDNFDALVSVVQTALSENDLVLINAGSSAGRDDLTANIIETVGEIFCHGIAIKPGKPTILGISDTTPIIGVPGYPVSGIIVVEQLVAPVVYLLGKQKSPQTETAIATLSRRTLSSLKYQEFVRVRLGMVEDKLIATPLDRGAGVINSFVKADGMLVIPQNKEGYEAEESVEVSLLRTRDALQNTLVVTGSHDPLIDEIAELIRQQSPAATLASTHVGSMGAIAAARRHEMHFGGIHLLDAETGEYNNSYIDRYLPEGGVYQVECVQRVQGIMVAAGNPFGISSVADLAKTELRYINRQKGSGTRILCDYLCARAKLDTAAIYGYDHEEATHTAVAAQIAAGSADAGMGIYSAAQLYGLEFVPLTLEQYDLLVPDYAWNLPLMQQVIEVLQSKAFRKRLTEMGGYELDNPGAIRHYYPRVQE